MKKEKIQAGLDAGHINTKAIIMNGQKVLGYGTAPTGFDIVGAAQTALNNASENAGISPGELGGVTATGIFKDMIDSPSLKVTGTVPEFKSGAKGALFLNKDSRTLIDIGGNVHKAVSYDQNGDLLDIIQNDKCADGVGIYYTTMAKALGMSEQNLTERALKSTRKLSVAIQCGLSAETDAIDLLCQGEDITDVAAAILRYIAERVADMSTYMSLTKEIVVAGGIAKSQVIIEHISGLLKQEISVLDHPEYVGAIGAVLSDEGEK
jgi:predicted CoA-substrate-specific enzyme activase